MEEPKSRHNLGKNDNCIINLEEWIMAMNSTAAEDGQTESKWNIC